MSNPVYTPITDPCEREAAWLTTVDNLPNLMQPAGPFDLVQSYFRTVQPDLRALYVTLPAMGNHRNATGQILKIWKFKLKISWPISSSEAEDNQQELVSAVDLTVDRLRGPFEDKTHGGRFWEVGELEGYTAAEGFDSNIIDPELALAQGYITAEIVYFASDFITSI